MALNALPMTTVRVVGATVEVRPLDAEGHAQLNCQMASLPMRANTAMIQMAVSQDNVLVDTVEGKCHPVNFAQRMTTVGMAAVQDGSHLVAGVNAINCRRRG